MFEIVFEIAGAKLWKTAGEKLLGVWTGLNIFRWRFGAFFELFVSLFASLLETRKPTQNPEIPPPKKAAFMRTFSESSRERLPSLGSQHPSPNVKTFCKFEPQIWLEIITSRDAKSACFKSSRTSCREIILGIFWPNFGQKRSHHVMDASCRFFSVTRVRNPAEIVQKNSFTWTFYFRWIFSGGFSSCELFVLQLKTFRGNFVGCGFLCLQLEASCLQWSFFTYSSQVYNFSFSAYSWSLFAYSPLRASNKGLKGL